MHKIEMVRFIEVNKHFWTLEAINFCIVYIHCRMKAKFQLDFRENKVVIFFKSALFWDITQRMAIIPNRRFGTTYRSRLQGSIQVHGPSEIYPRKSKGSANPSLRTSGLLEKLLTSEETLSICLI